MCGARLPVADMDGGLLLAARGGWPPDVPPGPALHKLRDDLYRSGARLPIPNTNEVRLVASNADVIRWILEIAGESYGAE